MPVTTAKGGSSQQSLDAPEELANQLIECPTCRETIEVPMQSRPSESQVSAPLQPPPATRSVLPPSQPARSSRQDDEVFFSEVGILVSKTRFVVDSQTFALAGITSVRGVETPPRRNAPIILLLLGAVFLAASVWFGLLVIAACIAWMCFQKSTFAVVLTTAGGEVKAYSSYDSAFISRAIQAVTEAIVARG